MKFTKISTLAALFFISSSIICLGQDETEFTRMTECYGKVAGQKRFMVFVHTGTFKEYDFADLSPHFEEDVAMFRKLGGTLKQWDDDAVTLLLFTGLAAQFKLGCEMLFEETSIWMVEGSKPQFSNSMISNRVSVLLSLTDEAAKEVN